jgi:hypothetical protein
MRQAAGGKKMRVQLHAKRAIRQVASGIAGAAVALAILGSSALAAPPVVRDHTASSGAGTSNTVCVGTVCTVTSIFAVVNNPDGSTQACLDITRYDQAGMSFVLLGYETGCTSIAQGFSIDAKGLSGAALSATDITVQAFTCDATGCNPAGTRMARVSATYTGIGDVFTFRANSKSTFGGCAMYFVSKGSSREATANLIVDGRSFDAVGSLYTSTQKIKILCH